MSTKILWNYFLKSSGIGGPVFMDNKSKNTASAGSNKNNTKIELFTLPSALYAEGSPVLLYGGYLYSPQDNSGQYFARPDGERR